MTIDESGNIQLEQSCRCNGKVVSVASKVAAATTEVIKYDLSLLFFTLKVNSAVLNAMELFAALDERLSRAVEATQEKATKLIELQSLLYNLTV
jgi:hypothetical protein